MSDRDSQERAALGMRVSFETQLQRRVERAAQVQLQHFIPAHWFSAAASECANMYIDGYFYGAISVAQAYVEALSMYLVDRRRIRGSRKDPLARWTRLRDSNVVSSASCDAAMRIFADRNDFHHLNRDVEQDYFALESRALECIRDLHAIESEVFAFTVAESGDLRPAHPDYWPGSAGKAEVHLRNLW